MSAGQAWILWDGQCTFCRRCVEWVRRRDYAGRFCAVAFQEAHASGSPPVTPELYQRCRKAVQVVMPDGTTIGGGEAIAFILKQVGYPRLGRLLLWGPILPLTECGYRLVAKNRGLLSRFLTPAK